MDIAGIQDAVAEVVIRQRAGEIIWLNAIFSKSKNAVLFVSESERIYQHEGIQAFMDNERAKADIPLQKGPFAIFF